MIKETAIPKSGSAKIKITGNTVTESVRKIICQSDKCGFASNFAASRIARSLAVSEGWNENDPKDIQR